VCGIKKKDTHKVMVAQNYNHTTFLNCRARMWHCKCFPEFRGQLIFQSETTTLSFLLPDNTPFILIDYINHFGVYDIKTEIVSINTTLIYEAQLGVKGQHFKILKQNKTYE
jgi:hypothetical protein